LRTRGKDISAGAPGKKRQQSLLFDCEGLSGESPDALRPKGHGGMAVRRRHWLGVVSKSSEMPACALEAKGAS